MTQSCNAYEFHDPADLVQAMARPPFYALVFRPSDDHPIAPKPLQGWMEHGYLDGTVTYVHRRLEREFLSARGL